MTNILYTNGCCLVARGHCWGGGEGGGGVMARRRGRGEGVATEVGKVSVFDPGFCPQSPRGEKLPYCARGAGATSGAERGVSK
jgi:hypothetical protein